MIGNEIEVEEMITMMVPDLLQETVEISGSKEKQVAMDETLKSEMAVEEHPLLLLPTLIDMYRVKSPTSLL